MNGESATLKETVENAADGSYSFTKLEYTGADLAKDADGNYVATTKTYKVVANSKYLTKARDILLEIRPMSEIRKVLNIKSK